MGCFTLTTSTSLLTISSPIHYFHFPPTTSINLQPNVTFCVAKCNGLCSPSAIYIISCDLPTHPKACFSSLSVTYHHESSYPKINQGAILDSFLLFNPLIKSVTMSYQSIFLICSTFVWLCFLHVEHLSLLDKSIF